MKLAQFQIDQALAVRTIFHKIQNYLNQNNITYEFGSNFEASSKTTPKFRVIWLEDVYIEQDILIPYVETHFIDTFKLKPTFRVHDVLNNQPGHTAIFYYGECYITIQDQCEFPLSVTAHIALNPATAITSRQK